MKRAADSSIPAGIDEAAATWVTRRDAGLSAEDARALERWLAADPRHAQAFSYYDSAWSALAKPTRDGSGQELERMLHVRARRRKTHRLVQGGALAALVLLGVSFFAFRQPTLSPTPAANTVVRMPARQQLPDGSLVELKGAARISVDYTSQRRSITLLEGEAHFDVQKDPARPFVVSAAGVEVRAVGTAFSVQMDTAEIEVLVTHGRVAVNKPEPTAPTTQEASPQPLATLDAGRRMVVDLQAKTAAPEIKEVPPAEMQERLAWRAVRLEFTHTPLGEAVEMLNRHAAPGAIRFAVTDPDVASTRISGLFRVDNTDALIVLLEGAFGLKADRSDDTITLNKAR